jgi:hypothetical protein
MMVKTLTSERTLDNPEQNGYLENAHFNLSFHWNHFNLGIDTIRPPLEGLRVAFFVGSEVCFTSPMDVTPR